MTINSIWDKIRGGLDSKSLDIRRLLLLTPKPLGTYWHFENKSLAFDKRHLDCYDWRLFVDIRKLRSLYALALFNFKLSYNILTVKPFFWMAFLKSLFFARYPKSLNLFAMLLGVKEQIFLKNYLGQRVPSPLKICPNFYRWKKLLFAQTSPHA